MRLPEQMPAKPLGFGAKIEVTAETSAATPAIEPAGCCVQVCDPLTGCHCLVHAPFC